jgi:peptide chain release factor 2
MNAPNFWGDQQNAKKITKQLSIVKSSLEKEKKISRIQDELLTYKMLLKEDFSDSLFQEAISIYKVEKNFIEQFEIEILLHGKYDLNSAFLTIHPGAGGTESQDWAEMLLRMYRYWAESSRLGFKVIDYLAGEVAGLKSATIEITGDFAYGYLKSEAGIHRLVRISPFNAQGKRQTSFVSIFVYPMLDDDIEIEIAPSDLKIDTYRASGAGGQHVNTTDSAVRITHLPTNIVSQCQNERSQIQNREKAMAMLRAKLYLHYEAEREKERQKHEATKTEIGWGNQIRSYVFHPYQMVKDHRTNYETGQVASVMDGNLNRFINAYLKYTLQSE